mgnify:FL=1
MENTTISSINSTTTPLASGASFTGTAQRVIGYSSVITSVKTDQAGTLSMQFSIDGTNWDSQINFSVVPDTNEIHRFSVSKEFYRCVFTNTSASPQTYLRLQTIAGSHQTITSPLNYLIQQDADSIVTRTISEEVSISQGLFQNYSIVNKFGKNPDIDTGTVPEDVWEVGGAYTGWAASAETLQVFSSSAADTSAGTGARTVRITGLDQNYDSLSETVTLNGVTPVVTTGSFLRVHTATVLSAGSGGVNAGTITVRQSTTTANVFIGIIVGVNQSNSSAYTIPAGYTGYMRSLHSACGTQAAVAVGGGIWTRPFGGVFRQRRPFYFGNSFRLSDIIYGGLVFTEKSDIIIRITECSTNNTPVNAGYDLILVKN